MNQSLAAIAIPGATAGMAGGTTDGKRGLCIVGATHALSGRTNFHADVDYAL